MSTLPITEDAHTGEAVNLCWTGGWDSTFRLLQVLFVERLPVQPFYIINPARRSSPREIKAMDHIRGLLLQSHPGTEQLLLPTHYVNFCDVHANEELTTCFNRLVLRAPLGTQYEWLARFAFQADLHDLELAIHRDDKTHFFLEGEVESVSCPSSGRGWWVLRPGAYESDLKLFRFFRFPLFEYTKIQTREEAAQQTFAEFLEHTWFCHAPRPDGTPCGMCAGCVYTREEGFSRRVPTPSLFQQLYLRVSRRIPWSVKRRLKKLR